MIGHPPETVVAHARVMDLLPHPAILERLMDDQSVLPRQASSVIVALMHEDLARLYREQLVALLSA